MSYPRASFPADPCQQGPPAPSARPAWWRELAMLTPVYLLYSLIRNAVPERIDLAQQNARTVLSLEHLAGMDVEHRVNAITASLSVLAVPANYYYATLHFTVTASVLVWIYVAWPAHYRHARSVLLTMTLLALAGYYLVPLAPPRLTTGAGFVDTVRYFGTWGHAPSDPVASASNQYAAMPSMHVGWALWSGLTVVRFARTRLVRVLGALYPAVTLLVVVATGNHFLLDAVAALVLFALACAAVDLLVPSPVRAGSVERERELQETSSRVISAS